MSITLIAGLGNPGREYNGTRHNLGFTVVEALAAAEGLSWKHEARFHADIARWNVRPGVTRWLVKPQTYMNDSGRSLRLLLDFHKLPVDALAAAYDDLTIEIGRIKVTEGGSAGGHNGVASLLEQVGTGFARYRLGIASLRPAEMDIKDFVLGKFTEDEKIIIQQQLTRFVAGLRLLIENGCAQAMNSLNRREKNDTDQA